jgi:plasmid maintenance system antidote protein VapI
MAAARLPAIPTCRLCKFFGLSEGYFLRLQNAYDTLEAKRRIAAATSPQLTKTSRLYSKSRLGPSDKAHNDKSGAGRL